MDRGTEGIFRRTDCRDAKFSDALQVPQHPWLQKFSALERF